MNAARQAALESGNVFFDVGIDCRRGHGTLRYAKGGACPSCIESPVRSAVWVEQNKKAKRVKYQFDMQYREIIKDRVKVRRQFWTDKDRAVERERSRAKYEADSIYYNVKARFRQERERQATPKWLTRKQLKAIRRFFEQADLLYKITFQPYEVDHIVPLRGKTVCGLNVPWNLQVLSRKENRRKWDKLPDEKDLICRTAPAYRQLVKDSSKQIRHTTTLYEGLRSGV